MSGSNVLVCLTVMAASLVGAIASADHLSHVTQFVNNFGQGLNTDPESEQFGGGDDLWSNPANWNNHGPPSTFVNPMFAFINVDPVPGGMSTARVNSPGAEAVDMYIGQGAGSGHVLVTSGGELNITGTVHVARDSGRDGLFEMDGGIMNVGVRDPSGAVLTVGNFFLGHQGGTATGLITGGDLDVTGSIRVADTADDTTANGFLTVTGGTVTMNGLLALGVRTGGIGTGRGEFTVGGDAIVNIGANVAMRPGAGNSFTVQGSAATININRPGATATGFEVHQDNDVNFVFDAGGISPIAITEAQMRWSDASSTLNVDASAFAAEGTFDLFTFAGGYFPTGITQFGTENLTFAPGFSGSVAYNPNSITLSIVESAGLPGDFDMDGKVDAADYVVWRKNDGNPTTYDQWRANFGAMSSGGGAAAAAVPEPMSLTLLLVTGGVAAIAAAARRRR